MATTKISITKKTWTLISAVSVSFQLNGQSGGYCIEAGSLPTDLSIKKKISPGKIYRFTRLDGNLYIYSLRQNEVGIDPA